MQLIDRVKAARNASVPLVAITTPDPAAVMQAIREGLGSNGDGKTPLPMFKWDAVQGIRPVNTAGAETLTALGMSQDDLSRDTTLLSDALVFAARLPGESDGDAGKRRGSILFVLNAHRFLDLNVQGSAVAAQAVWNLRDVYKTNRRTLVLLAPQIKLPQELQQDVIVFDDPLPSDKALGEIVVQQAENAGLPAMLEDAKALCVDAVRGLAAFTAEQTTAMSVDFDFQRIDLEALWERKRVAVEQTPGLKVSRFRETLDMAGGLAAIRKFGLAILNGNARPRVILHWDEVDKAFAGAGTQGVGDNTGVSQDAHSVWLQAMENNRWTGILCPGPPGSGKTLFARSLGNSVTPRVETVTIDSGAMKASLVGASEGLVRGAVKAIEAMAGPGGAFFVATCNKLEALPPEFRRRFTMGIWFFDLPTKEERRQIWLVNLGKYDLVKTKPGDMPDDTDWTGADIRNVCDIAWRLRITPKEAANYIVPVAKSDPEAIDRLRRQAHGRFLSASKPGVYQMADASASLAGAAATAGRVIPTRQITREE